MLTLFLVETYQELIEEMEIEKLDLDKFQQANLERDIAMDHAKDLFLNLPA